jgi:mannitol/fructose-specific phosphotransferase system IIA component (Ntr-type)
MRLLDILQGKLIIPRMRSRDKWTAIAELVDKLVEEHEIRIFDQPEVLEAVLTREKSRSTGLDHRVALPHGRSRVIEDLIGVLGIAPEGIPFDSTDGEDAQIICLLVIPEAEYRDHIKTLADVAYRLSDEVFRAALCQAGSNDSRKRLLEVIEAMEGPAFLQEDRFGDDRSGPMAMS